MLSVVWYAIIICCHVVAGGGLLRASERLDVGSVKMLVMWLSF